MPKSLFPVPKKPKPERRPGNLFEGIERSSEPYKIDDRPPHAPQRAIQAPLDDQLIDVIRATAKYLLFKVDEYERLKKEAVERGLQPKPGRVKKPSRPRGNLFAP